jgi:quercetin dioxygenase-like cupin family protein
MTFHVDGTDYKAGPGSFVSLPRGLPHTFTIESPSCR